MRGARTRKAVALAAVAAALMLPATAAGGEGPTASKSGVLINYVSGNKLKVAKTLPIVLVCSANCNVTSVSTLKGPRLVPDTVTQSGSLAANAPGGPIPSLTAAAQKLIKSKPGRYKLANTTTATNTATGAVETIKRTFGFKR